MFTVIFNETYFWIQARCSTDQTLSVRKKLGGCGEASIDRAASASVFEKTEADLMFTRQTHDVSGLGWPKAGPSIATACLGLPDPAHDGMACFHLTLAVPYHITPTITPMVSIHCGNADKRHLMEHAVTSATQSSTQLGLSLGGRQTTNM